MIPPTPQNTKVQRYDLISDHQHMDEYDNGDYVRFTDYAVLLAENTQLREKAKKVPKDELRYRWLRDWNKTWSADISPIIMRKGVMLADDELDRAIDAALKPDNFPTETKGGAA